MLRIRQALSDRPRQSFAVTLILLYFLSVFLLSRCLNISCIWKYLFHIPCPGCGYTRALLAAASLDFKLAWKYHPLFFLFPLLVWLVIKDGKIFSKENYNLGLIILTGLLFLIVWVVRLIHHTIPV